MPFDRETAKAASKKMRENKEKKLNMMREKAKVTILVDFAEFDKNVNC